MSCVDHVATQTWCPLCAPGLATWRDNHDLALDVTSFERETPMDVAALRAEAQDVLRGPLVPLEARLWRPSPVNAHDPRATITGSGQPSPLPLLRPSRVEPTDTIRESHEAALSASAARIAGLERSVNEKLAVIEGLRAQVRDTEALRCAASATITDITDALGITGGHAGIPDSEALEAVREYVAVVRCNYVARDETIAALTDEVARLSAPDAVAIATAQRDAARDKLRKVLAVLTRIGGYMSTEDQRTLGDARAEVA